MRIATCLFLLLPCGVCAQVDSSWNQQPVLKISGFVDVFYAYDFNKPQTDVRQAFFYNHNRHNEVNLNLGFLKLALAHPKYRANLALQTGTYVIDNYAAEPGPLKNIYEANAGIALNKANTTWLDAGIFGSYIGFESAISMDNWTLTRSIVAENSPYYLSGIRLTHATDDRWEWGVWVVNGWQRIKKIPGNSLPSVGTQLKRTLANKGVINWSTFIGTDDPDSTRRMRYYSDLYLQFPLTARLGLLVGFDAGAQQITKNSSGLAYWFSPVVIARYTLKPNWAMALRAEYYQDKMSVIIPVTNANGFRTTGLSVNVDYTPVSNVACRVEGRWLYSPDRIFRKEANLLNTNGFIVASIALRLDR